MLATKISDQTLCLYVCMCLCVLLEGVDAQVISSVRYKVLKYIFDGVIALFCFTI